MQARYRCTKVEPGTDDNGRKTQETVCFDPVYDAGNPVTYGSVTLGFEDPAQFGQFEKDKEYLFTITPAP